MARAAGALRGKTIDTLRRPTPRLAVRAVLLHDTRLLLVNAWPSEASNLWCAPGGGVEPGKSLPDNLAREVREETGLEVEVGLPCLVNEFHDPSGTFHQVEVFFRCSLAGGSEIADWRDPEGIVTRRRWVSRAEYRTLRVKPGALEAAAWDGGFNYDPLEAIVE